MIREGRSSPTSRGASNKREFVRSMRVAMFPCWSADFYVRSVCGIWIRGRGYTRKPCEVADICARNAVTLFMIFFWCPTSVMPRAVSSWTVTRAAASNVVTPARSKLSAYRDILMEASHSLTEFNCVRSTASGASGFVPLSKTMS